MAKIVYLRFQLIIFVFLRFFCFINTQQITPIINCYYESWTQWRPGAGNFPIKLINANLCTHITYSFIGLYEDGSINLYNIAADMPALHALKQQNPNIKLLISMGGYNEPSSSYSIVSSNLTLRTAMVNNIFDFVTTNNFDGFDLDWEYPAQRGGAPSDKVSYIELLKDLRNKFSGTNLLITTAVAAVIQNYQTSYDVPNMNQYIDYFNIMAYDYHGSWESVTGQNAPLYPSSTNPNEILNLNSSIHGWITAGATPEKILMGTAFYGRSYTLASSSNTGLGAPSTGAGSPGAYTQQAGMLDYLELCEDIKMGKWTTVFDNQQKVPYAYSGNQWIGYDNPKSLKLKVQFVNELNLAGVMIWSVDSDDANNVCGGGKYTLLTSINEAFQMSTTVNPITSTVTTSITTSVPTISTTTNKPSTTEPTIIPTSISTTTTRQTTSATTTRQTTSTTTPRPVTTTYSNPITTTTTRPTNTSTTRPTTTNTTRSTTVSTSTTTISLPSTTPSKTTTLLTTRFSTTTKPTTTKPTTTKPTTTKPTTKNPPKDYVCTSIGTFRHATDCRFFYRCLENGFGGLVAYMFECPSNLFFSLKENMCLYPSQVPECNQ